MYKTILVPHGGTEAGDNALRHAIHLAKQDSAKIIILHVIEPWPDPSFGYWMQKDTFVKEHINSILDDVEESARKFLAERVALCRKEGIQSQGIFKNGKPSDSIINFSKEEKVDLIVMGKRKKIPNYKSLFRIGSVTRKIQEHVDCSVLLVETPD